MTERQTLAQRIAAELVRRRSSMPRWMSDLVESVAKNPDAWPSRLAARLLGGGGTPPAPTEVPDAPVRVYIGPTNYSEQGWRWGRALEAADPRISARNMSLEIPGTFAFRADSSVPLVVQSGSRAWREAEYAAVTSFTHVLFEAERTLFGPLFARDLRREQAALERAGVSVAFMAHGTDVRSPSRHRELTPWSPFTGDDLPTERLQADADANIAILERAGRPLFVSTPDLLNDVPSAMWCPVVVDPAEWSSDRPVADAERLVVMHAPSSPTIKGTALVEPTMRELSAAGVIDYRQIRGVTSSEMPSTVAGCDILLDQFRIGSYGVAAVEAMAAGRVVLGHVLPTVRREVEATTGLELPVVEATPDTVGAVVTSLAGDAQRMRAVSAAGVRFVEAVHSGAMSARVLIDGWIEPR